MKGRLFLTLALVLALTGCAGTPQSKEAGSTLEVSILGAEPAEEGLQLYAAAERRLDEGSALGQGVGATPAAALEALESQGEQMVSCAHVEHLLLAQSAAGRLPDLLSYAFQDPQQSTETQLWVVRADKLSGVFSGQWDVARRMEVLKATGKDRQGFMPVTLREAAGALAQGEPVLLPALEPGDEDLTCAGSALYDRGELTIWFTGDAALGAALLLGQRIHWTDSLGGQAVSLQSAGCRLVPVWDSGNLVGLTVRCKLEGVRTGGWTGELTDLAPLERRTGQAIRAALEQIQAADAGGLLAGRAGLSRPWQWQALSRQWNSAFPNLSTDVQVKITVAAD